MVRVCVCEREREVRVCLQGDEDGAGRERYHDFNYRGTSLIRTRPPLLDHYVALGIYATVGSKGEAVSYARGTLHSAAPACISCASLRWRVDYSQNGMLSVRCDSVDFAAPVLRGDQAGRLALVSKIMGEGCTCRATRTEPGESEMITSRAGETWCCGRGTFNVKQKLFFFL